MATVRERFDALVDRRGEHHLWTASVDRYGTPQMRVSGRLTTGRRVAWELAHGPLPPGERVAACPGEPRCVRVGHLRLRRAVVGVEPPPPPRQRASRGGGWVRQIRPGVWKVTVSGHDEAGAPVRRSRTLVGSRADADAAAAELAVEVGGRARTLDALVAAYLAQLEVAGRSPTTLRRYRQLWRQWLSPILGGHQPDELTRLHLERALAAMHRRGQSRSSIHQAAVLVNGALGWAPSPDLTDGNPVQRCRLPDGTRITGNRHR